MRFIPRSAAVLAAAAFFPVLVMAQEQAPQGPPPQGGRGGMRRMAPARQPMDQAQGRMGGRPQLTDQQHEQVRAFDEQQRQTLEATRREIGDLHRQLNEALTASQLDNGKINSLRSSIVQKETALAQARVDRLAKLSSILTAEQRQSLRGRALGEVFGPGRPGGGGRGGAMAMPRGRAGGGGPARGMIQRRQGVERQMQQRRGLRGGGAGGGMMVPRGRGGAPGRGGMIGRGGGGGRGVGPQRGPLNAPGAAGAGNDARLRAEIRRLEAQLEMLRRRIR
jgi:Spy/CpxP family protein refolding chaperone